MASFYELTEKEVEHILECMELYRKDTMKWTTKDALEHLELMEYLKTRERKQYHAV